MRRGEAETVSETETEVRVRVRLKWCEADVSDVFPFFVWGVLNAHYRRHLT